MRKQILVLHFALCILPFGFAQQYGWKSITVNLPKFYRDTTIINGGADTIIANISGITFLDDNHGWISTYHPFDGDPSAVLETTDGGQTWIEHSAPFAGADIHMIDEMNGYFGAINGFVYKTTDGAQTWTLHGLLSAPLYDLGFPPRPSENGFVGGKDGHMAQITPEGVFPIDLGLAGSVYCIDFPSEQTGYALLDYQMIIYYLNEEWHVEASYPFSSKNWLFFLNDMLGWCVGEMFLKTTVGIDWYRTDPEFVQKGAMMGVFFTDENNGWAVGTLGQIAYSNDGGEDWTMLEHNLTEEILTGVLFTSPYNGYITGGDKTILKYGPVSWIPGSAEQKLEVYPNPTMGKIVVESHPSHITKIELLDLFGKVMMHLWEGKSGQDKMEFDVSQLPAGIYFLRVSNGSSVAVTKLLKQ